MPAFRRGTSHSGQGPSGCHRGGARDFHRRFDVSRSSVSRLFRIDSEHVQARHNLELLRLFIKHIQSEWDRIDRERERQEKELLEFLALLEKRQLEIRNDVRELSSLSDLSAQRQQMTEVEKRQTELHEEIDPLKEKIAAEFASASAGQPGTAAPSASPPQLDEQTQRALEMLTAIADDAGEAMQKSASLIRSGETAAAADSQRQVLDHFHQIFLAVSPFQSVLQRAITEQDGNLNRTQPLTQPENDGQSAKDARAVADDADPEQDPATAQDDLTNTSRTAHSPTVDEDAQKEDLPWYQQRITDYSRMLTLKAESTLPAIEQQLGQLEAAATDDPPTESDEAPPEKFGDDGESVDSTDAANSASTATPSPTDESTDSDPEQQPDPAEQLRALQNALRKAIELGPSAVEHSELAGAALSTSDYSTASDEETETLRILREIAEELPPPPEQDQSQEGEQNQDTDSDSQEDQSSDQQNDQSQQDSGEEDQEQNPEDQTAGDQKSEDEQSDGQTKDEQPEEQSSKQTPQERAESILRRAQERERKHREMQKQLRALLGERIRVERDW